MLLHTRAWLQQTHKGKHTMRLWYHVANHNPGGI